MKIGLDKNSLLLPPLPVGTPSLPLAGHFRYYNDTNGVLTRIGKIVRSDLTIQDFRNEKTLCVDPVTAIETRTKQKIDMQTLPESWTGSVLDVLDFFPACGSVVATAWGDWLSKSERQKIAVKFIKAIGVIPSGSRTEREARRLISGFKVEKAYMALLSRMLIGDELTAEQIKKTIISVIG